MIPKWKILHKKWHRGILSNGNRYNMIVDELGRFRSMVRVCEFLGKRGFYYNGRKWHKKAKFAPAWLVNLGVR